MKRLMMLIAALGLVAVAIPVTAQEEEPEFDRHPHMMLQEPELAEVDGVLHLVGYRKCVDLANNETVPLHAHHERLHFGDSGVSLNFETFESQSGNVVIPAAPFPEPFFPAVPWNNCEDFATFLPLPLE